MSFGRDTREYEEEARRKFKKYGYDMQNCWYKRTRNIKTNAVAECQRQSYPGNSSTRMSVKCGKNEGYISTLTPLVGLRVVIKRPKPDADETVTLKMKDSVIRNHVYMIGKPISGIRGEKIEELMKDQYNSGSKGFGMALGYEIPENHYIIPADTPMYSKDSPPGSHIIMNDTMNDTPKGTVGVTEQKSVCSATLSCSLKRNGKIVNSNGMDISVLCPLEGRMCPENHYKCITDNRFKLIKSGETIDYAFEEKPQMIANEEPRIIPAEEIARRLLGTGSNR